MSKLKSLTKKFAKAPKAPKGLLAALVQKKGQKMAKARKSK